MERKRENKNELARRLIEERQKRENPVGRLIVHFDDKGNVRKVEDCTDY